ncbi:MAG TPA: FAD-binding oxidoreductase [Candidatus Dormibacteraeota bacterium]|nr:FAD-binding oxidoreductase [Candidatus Dormibacteraeota bacterium]
MTGPGNQFHSLAKIVGETNTSAEPQALAAFAIDGHLPSVVVRPSNAEEIAEILRFCGAEKLAAIPAGGATKLRMGAAPVRYDVALVTTRLERITAYDPGDLTVSVEAGARLGEITHLLSEHRQLLPLAVPFLGQATVGGTVASGIDSPLRQLYGTVRDFLLGIEFVTGDGIHAKSGARVVKNVAGYDLHKLFIGSLGTLVVITRLNFKTFPVPEASGAFLATFASESGVLELLRKIRKSPLRGSALEVFSPTLSALFARRMAQTAPDRTLPSPWLSGSAWALAAHFGGNDRVMHRYKSELESMAGAAGANGSTLLPEDARAALWDHTREMVPLLLDESPAAMIVRVSALPNRLGDVFAAAQQSGDRHELPVAILARAAGVAYIAFLPNQSNGEIGGRLAQAARELADAAAEAQGFSFVAWCPPELKGRLSLWGKERTDLPLMRNVKQAFDPGNTLSPGRFMGGI